MFATSQLVLQKLSTGEKFTYVLRRLTLQDKCTLDEWMRRRYVFEALKEVETGKDVTSRKIVFATANELDFLANSWILPDQIWLARFIWQCIADVTKPTFEVFFQQYFEHEIGEKEQNERFDDNMNAIRESRGFVVCENPTAKKEDSQTDAESPSGNTLNS